METISTRPDGGTTPHDAIALLVTYLWDEEIQSYKHRRSDRHIFNQLVTVANWMNQGPEWTALEYLYASKHAPGFGCQGPNSYRLPWFRPYPSNERLASLRHSPLTGFTLDVTDVAKAEGIDFAVSLTTNLWDRLVANHEACDENGDEARLSEVLKCIARACRDEGSEFRTWMPAGSAGSNDVVPIKGLFVGDKEFSTRLVVMLSWEGLS